MLRALAVIAVLATSVAFPAGVDTARAQTPSTGPLLLGDIPEDGGMALVASASAITPGRLVDALRASGCEPLVLAATEGGAFILYGPDAPPFVNEGFPTPLAGGRGVAVRCARPEVPDAHLLRIVTKDEALPSGFVPDDLVLLPAALVMPGGGNAYLTEEAAAAVTELLDAAAQDGYDIRVRSAYRSYDEQVFTYNYWVSTLGQEEASRRSAEPGHSEHQLGTVVDVTSASIGWELEPEFGDTPEGLWIHEHAWEYGFVVSYPEGAEEVTGYRYEPWHLRYIGRTHADWLRVTDLTLTEYLARIHAGD